MINTEKSLQTPMSQLNIREKAPFPTPLVPLEAQGTGLMATPQLSFAQTNGIVMQNQLMHLNQASLLHHQQQQQQQLQQPIYFQPQTQPQIILLPQPQPQAINPILLAQQQQQKLLLQNSYTYPQQQYPQNVYNQQLQLQLQLKQQQDKQQLPFLNSHINNHFNHNFLQNPSQQYQQQMDLYLLQKNLQNEQEQQNMKTALNSNSTSVSQQRMNKSQSQDSNTTINTMNQSKIEPLSAQETVISGGIIDRKAGITKSVNIIQGPCNNQNTGLQVIKEVNSDKHQNSSSQQNDQQIYNNNSSDKKQLAKQNGEELNQHYKEFFYSCKECGKNFLHEYILNYHIKSCHSNVQLKCKKCDNFQTTNYIEFNKHCKEVHKEEIFQCDLCSYKTDKPQKLTRHKDNIHFNSEEVKCELCEYKTSNKINLKRHIKTVHQNQVFSCDQCDFMTNTNQNLSRHILNIHNRQDIKCDYEGCTYIAANKNYLYKHVKKMHTSVTCDICHNFSAPNKAGISSHKFQMHSTRLIKCPYCTYQTPYEDNLKIHQKNRHFKDMKHVKKPNPRANHFNYIQKRSYQQMKADDKREDTNTNTNNQIEKDSDIKRKSSSILSLKDIEDQSGEKESTSDQKKIKA